MAKKIIVNDVEVEIFKNKKIRNCLCLFECAISETFTDRKRCFPAYTDEELIDLLKRYSETIKEILDGQIRYVQDFLGR